MDALRDHLAAYPVRGRGALVFPGRDGELLAPSALYGREERVAHRGGKASRKRAYGSYAAREVVGKPELHWHDLRRTAATLGAQSGATVREMQHRLGRTPPTMALRYQAATAERDRAIADRLQVQIDRLRAAGTVTHCVATRPSDRATGTQQLIDLLGLSAHGPRARSSTVCRPSRSAQPT